MSMAVIDIPLGLKPWDTVMEIANIIPRDEWLLVGGLMTQAHAMLSGHTSRATKDIDVLIDVLASSSNVSKILSTLENIGFEAKEPGLRGSPFHRMTRNETIVDILIADHLPKSRAKSVRVNRWPMMEVPGGAQAVNRKMDITLTYGDLSRMIQIPNLLGALILKSAAYCSDNRDRQRHLDDVALLASLIENHKECLSDLHGSDRKRLRAVAEALSDSELSSWKALDQDARRKGMMTLAILAK